MHWHGFATLQALRNSLADKRANRLWVDGNEGIAVHLNPEHFVSHGYVDRMFNDDMAWRLIPAADYEEMKLAAGADDNRWPDYQVSISLLI